MPVVSNELRISVNTAKPNNCLPTELQSKIGDAVHTKWRKVCYKIKRKSLEKRKYEKV